jgi:hypothetical protein
MPIAKPNSGDGGNRTRAKFPPNHATKNTATCREITADGHAVLVDAEHAWMLGRWTWRLESNPARSSKAYVVRHTTLRINGRDKGVRIYLHRAVLGLPPGDLLRVDHINGDTLDNRRANLRVATTAQNAQNQGSRGGSSRHRGVTWDKSRKKWMATATLDGRRRTIGRFGTEEEAARCGGRMEG